MNNTIGNITTIGKFIATMIAGWIISLCIANGLDLGVDAVTLAEVIGAIIGLIYGYIDAKYPNTLKFLGNGNTAPAEPVIEDVLNDEYITEFGDDADGGC